MHQLTLRLLPEPLGRKLRALAHEKGLSLNKTVISLLKQAVGLDQKPLVKKYRDVASVFGRGWTDEEFKEFEKNTEFFEQKDMELLPRH
jgi:hypothetical protein